MNLRGMVVAFLSLAILGSSAPALTAGDGWFGGSKEPAFNGTTTGTKKSGMTSWLPSWPTSKPKAKSNKPSMLSSMTKSTKNAWNKTVSFINPFDNPPKSKVEPAGPLANSGGWFSSPKKPDEPVTSPSDFLGQERLKW